jgi:hypothetical protein
MSRHSKHAGQRTRLSGTFVPLLVALLSVLVLAPLVEHHLVLTSSLVSLLLLTGVFTVHRSPPLRLAAILGLAVALFLRWLAHFSGPEQSVLRALSHLSACGYVAYLAAVVLFTVLTHREITHNTVIGALCGYLLIAYMFAFAYVAVEVLSPGSISLPDQRAETEVRWQPGTDASALMYFSFTTLTTLGYGDVLPVSPLARSLAVLEVLAGQLYLAAFVARLVGAMQTGRSRDGPDDGAIHA